MRSHIKILTGLVLSLFALQSYAIHVNVRSSSNQVSALGFTVNGKSHGGAGKHYSKGNLPTGLYSFGIRINGVFGNDVGCATPDGKKSITLNSDTTAILKFNGRQCTVLISGRG